jgi:ankyrin repeat protein
MTVNQFPYHPPLYHHFSTKAPDENNISLPEGNFKLLPNELTCLILELLANLNCGNEVERENKRSILLTCKYFYWIGFPCFHKEITTDFFLKKIGIKENHHLLNFFIFPHENGLEGILSKVNIGADGHLAIRLASQRGHSEVVKLLLEDKRVDPSACNNEAIRWASKNGHLEVVKLLLQDGRVDPSDQNNSDQYSAIHWASQFGHLEVVKLILEGKRVDPSVGNNRAIRWASERGHSEVVKLLLEDKRVDPSASNNFAIRWASKNGHSEVVKLLLEDKRVDSSACNNEAIYFASK